MAGLRKGISYRFLERPYTRKSKFKYKNYVKAVPNSKVVRYDMGDVQKQYAVRVDLIAKDALQIRHNAIESARQIVNRHLILKLKNNYYLKIRMYPHHVLRENKMLTGAGADRMQTGMQLAFGRPVGIAAQIRRGKPIISVKVDKADIDAAKYALRKATPRLPGHYGIAIVPLQ
ncbi:50S ribosomal protein L16 [Candidatus Woesearchaeota archaeon]|nr:50S ribosomal protein L16 [Candidatus Woesearchaeota archaeon]